MSERKGKKRVLISISSDEDEKQESGSQQQDDNSDDDHFEDIITSDSCGWEDEEFLDDDDSSSFAKRNGKDDNGDVEEDTCNKVTRLLTDGSQMQELNLIECKTYLRKLRLRVSGTKADCINRIKEHWRVKDGNGEALYPRSSFNINCTGDVCKGDVVLFRQKVYQKFDKLKRSGNILGKRTIVGRIVKESYGAANQQHTFTVEVLWSKGINKLPPLFPLLVKGRNLYKMKTFRQCWKNESERLAVLAEKHKRGAAARDVRAMKKSKKNVCTIAYKKELRVEGSGKRQKLFENQLSQTHQRIKPHKESKVHQKPYTRVKNVRSEDHVKNSSAVNHRKRQSAESRHHRSSGPSHKIRDSTSQCYASSSRDFYQAQAEFERQRAQLSSPFERAHILARLPHSRPYADDQAFLASEHQRHIHSTYPHHAYGNPIHEPSGRSFSRFPVFMDTYRPYHPYPCRRDAYGP